jgi:predicted transcriptional regulator
MSTLLELAAQLVTSQVSKTPMTADQMISEIQKVHAGLKQLDKGQQVQPTEQIKPSITVKEAFKKNEVVCMVCGKGGFKTLKKHLQSHGLKPGEYKKQFGISSKQALTAKSYSDARRKTAVERGLADKLALAQQARIAKIGSKSDGVVVEENSVVEVLEAV